MSAWQTFSRKLVEAAAMASPSVVSKRALQAWSPSVLSKLALRSPLTHLLGKRQCRRLPSLAVCSQVSLAPSALPSQATALVLKYCPPEVLARLAVTSAAWACRILEHAAAEETWAAWAAMAPRPTLQHMQQVCAACTLRLPPSQTIEGLSAMEVTHLAYSPPQMAHVALHSHTRHRHAARTIHPQPLCWQLALSEYDAKAAEHGFICTCHPPRGHAPTAPAHTPLQTRGLFLVPVTDFLTPLSHLSHLSRPHTPQASCVESGKLPVSWLDAGLGGSLPEILGAVVCARPPHPHDSPLLIGLRPSSMPQLHAPATPCSATPCSVRAV